MYGIRSFFVSRCLGRWQYCITFHLQRKDQQAKYNQAKGHQEGLIYGENLRNMYFQSKDQFVFAEV